jgi:hypothetical protein
MDRAHNLEPVEHYVRALIFAASKSIAHARKYAKQAYKGFEELEHEWRAARSALLLHQTGCGEKWLLAAREKARNYPRSFIAVELQAIAADSSCATLSLLTPRQRQVLRRILPAIPWRMP